MSFGAKKKKNSSDTHQSPCSYLFNPALWVSVILWVKRCGRSLQVLLAVYLFHSVQNWTKWRPFVFRLYMVDPVLPCFCLRSNCTPGIVLLDSNCEVVKGTLPFYPVSSSHPHQLYISIHTIWNSDHYTRSVLDLTFQVEWWKQLGCGLRNTQPRSSVAVQK